MKKLTEIFAKKTVEHAADETKKHVSKHKEAYLTGLVTTTVGIAIGMKLNPRIINVDTVNKNVNVPILSWKPKNTQMILQMIDRSTPSKPVHLKGTNLYFNSLSEASRATGHPLSMISRQVNGLIKDVHGDVFELLEKVM